MIGSVSWPGFSLRAKIVVPFVLVVALVGTIGTAVVSAQVTNESVAAFDGSLLRASLLANDHLSLLEAARLTTLRAAADTTGVAEATVQHDNAALQRLLTPVVANAGVNGLVVRVLDRQGSEVIALGTGDAGRGEAIASRLRAGAAMVNDAISYFAIAEAPHGGCSASGWGRTHGKAGLQELVRTKYIDVDRLPHREKPWWFRYGRELERAADSFLRFEFGGIGGRLRHARGALKMMFRKHGL